MEQKNMFVKRIGTKERVLINNIVRKLSKIKEVKAIYLFGSYARGEHLPFSDIDICVITNRNIPEHKKSEILSDSDEKVDISLFWDLPIAIRFRVFKEGAKLLERDGRFLQDMLMKTIREYFDFQPAIKKFAKAVGVSYG